MDIPNGGDSSEVGNGGEAAGMWLGLVSSFRGHSAAVYSTLESVVTLESVNDAKKVLEL